MTILKKILAVVTGAAMALSLGLSFASTSVAQAATMGTYIKGSRSTVYWYATDGRRYVLPNERTFNSWMGTTYSPVVTLSDTELYTLPIGGNVTYRPGYRLVKITSDPRVYAVARYGVLRWVSSESVARDLYGPNWNRLVDDIPVEFFTNYTVGSPIYSSYEYSRDTEYSNVTTPNDNISGLGNNSSYTYYDYNYGYPYNYSNGTATITPDRVSVYNGETVTIRFQANNTYQTPYKIEIRDSRNNSLITTCYNTSSCSYSPRVYTNSSGSQDTVRFWGNAFDSQNRLMASVETQAIAILPWGSSYDYNYSYPYNYGSFYGTLTLTSDTYSVREGQSITLRTRLSNVNANMNDVRVRVYDDRDSRLIGECRPNSYNECTFTDTVRRGDTVNSYRYRAIATNTYSGQTLNTAYTDWLSITTNYSTLSNSSIQGAIVNRWTSTGSETVRYEATLSNTPSNLSSVTIRIYDSSNNQLLRECSNTTVCSTDITRNVASTVTVYARATDAYGTSITSNSTSISFSPTPYTPPTPTTQVTGVSAWLDSGNSCSAGSTVRGTITVNAPTTVTYTWERSDGAQAGTKTLSFSAAGSQTVSETWLIGSQYSGWMRLRVLTPNAMSSAQVQVGCVY